jgi:glycosyltransferase involved in cell wall biosynthesis
LAIALEPKYGHKWLKEIPLFCENLPWMEIKIMNNPLVSVIVCTHNRADVLAGCLESLVGQTSEKDLFEVIVVDNNSTDATQEIARTFSSRVNGLRIVKELEQGLSNARNHGYREAAGRYVAYIDDDAMAYPDWIYQIISFAARHPEIQVFGGPYYAFSLVQIPEWFPPEYGSSVLGTEERRIDIGKEWLDGTNMVFTRDLLLTFGGFDRLLGMSGQKIAYGEETKLLLEISRNNIPVFYVPAIRVRHLISEDKMLLTWLLQSSYASGRCYAQVMNNQRSIWRQMAIILLCLKDAVLRMLMPSKLPFKRRLYYAFMPMVREFGVLIECL